MGNTLNRHTVMDDELMRFLVDEERTYRHGRLQLQRLPIGFLQVKGNGIIGNRLFRLLPEQGACFNGVNQLPCHGNLIFRLL